MILRNKILPFFTRTPGYRGTYYKILRGFATTPQNFYQILGVNQNASPSEIKASYYKLAKQYHPDVNKGSEEKFKEINQAYETLSDAAKKRQYDDQLKYGAGSSTGAGSYSSAYQNRSNYNQSYHYGHYKPGDRQKRQGYTEENQSYYYNNRGDQGNNYQRFYEEFRSNADFSNFKKKWYEEYQRAQEV